MPTTPEQRAEISRQNGRKSHGPTSEEGKAVSRRNALTHGLAATTIDPVDAPGEPHGAYRARLDAWVADTEPRNVLELAMIQRACRASWKLDRCARYEDAAAALRQARGDSPADPGREDRRRDAEHLGALLMCTLGYSNYADDPPDYTPPSEPDPFDDAPRDADALARSPEGVRWLLDAWAEVLPYLPGPDAGNDPDAPTPEGSEAFLRRARLRARRLLGIPTGAPAPAQPLREAGEAEVRRLTSVLDAMGPKPEDRLDADLALFGPGPEAQLLMRYEVQAERELHRAVNTFLKLRKEPGLVPAPEPAPEAPALAPAPAPVAPAPAVAGPAPAQNEPGHPARPWPCDDPRPRPQAPRAPRNGRPRTQ